MVPGGKGILAPFDRVLAKEPPPEFFYLHRSKLYRNALIDTRTMLQHTVAEPTKCANLVQAHPDVIGVMDASKEAVGGIIIGENIALPPTVFRYKWPPFIVEAIISATNPDGTITNSDLECGGLLFLWIVIEYLVDRFAKKNIRGHAHCPLQR